MGLNKFNQWGSGSSGSFLLHRMKPTPLTTQLYGQGNGTSPYIPVVRSGASDKSFKTNSDTTIELFTTSSLGAETSVANITYTTYLSGGQSVAMHMNSADTCMYILLRVSNSLGFIKVNDTTGVVTTIGASFTPTTPLNWPTIGAGMTLMEVDSGSGHLKITCNGVVHLVNKTTGAIVSQDTPVVIGSFLAKGVYYVTQDGTTGLALTSGVSSLVSEYAVPPTVHSTYGHVAGYALPQSLTGYIRAGEAATVSLLALRNYLLVDNDKVLNASTYTASPAGWKLYPRTEFDKLITSVAELGAGVI